jgi:hypothetical protein
VVSNGATHWAWTIRGLSKSQRLVLLRLADRARAATGRTWPTVGTLATECELSEWSTRRALRHLADRGLIGVDQSRGYRPSTYTVQAENPGANRGVNPVRNRAEPGDRPRRTLAEPAPYPGEVQEKFRARRPVPTASGRAGAPEDDAAGVAETEAVRALDRALAAGCSRCDAYGVIEHADGTVERCTHQEEDHA